jgi:mono/diheme cytochrome c family protein
MKARWLLLALFGCNSDPAPTPITSSASASATATTTPSASEAPAAAETAADRATLTFMIEGKEIRRVRQKALVAAVGASTFTAYDPYYNKPKTYRALPLDKVLAHGFTGQKLDLASQHFVLHAKDGYTVPIDGKRLLEEGGHIAIDDVDTDNGWQPIGPQQVSPAPYYLVWSQDGQKDLTTHPRPWQLATIEISKFERSFPKTVPTGEPETGQAWAGFAIFREQCIRCHAINQQGGKVGPDLNVPQNITEYRAMPQIRAYISNPRTFRYGNMPANPHLDEDDLDALIGYLTAMKDHKDDPKLSDEH